MLRRVPILPLLLAIVASWGWAPARCDDASTTAPEIITLDAPLSAPDALDVDDYGRLYVLDSARDALMRFSSEGKLERLWPEGIYWGPMEHMDHDLCVASGGMVYITRAETKLTAGLRRIGPGAGNDREFSAVVNNYRAAMGSSDGSFYTHGMQSGRDYQPDTDVMRAFDPNGEEIASWLTPSMARSVLGPDGLIYAVRRVEREWTTGDGKTTRMPNAPPLSEDCLIYVYTTQGKLHHVVDLGDAVGGGALRWSRFAVDANGDIYIAYKGITRVDSKGRFRGRLSFYKSPDDKARSWANTFHDLAVRNGMVYILMSETDCVDVPTGGGRSSTYVGNNERVEIQAFTSDGHCIARYLSPRMPMDLPSKIAVQANGSYGIVEQGYRDARRFGSRDEALGPVFGHQLVTSLVAKPGGGYYISGWMSGGGNGTDVIGADGGVTALYRAENMKVAEVPMQMAIDPRNSDLWALCIGTLLHFTNDGKLSERFPSQGSWDISGRSAGFAIDRDGFFYASDVWGHSVRKLSTHGALIMEIGKPGSGLGELHFPQGISIDPKGNIFVADTGNSRIQVFDPDGKPLGFWGHRGTGPGELDRPTSLTFGPKDTLWIADTHNDRIVRVPLKDFWAQLGKEYVPEPVITEPKPQQLRTAGRVSITGVVIAGSEDLSDIVYVESPDRAWGVSVALPKGKYVMRGQKCRLIGTRAAARRHVTAESLELAGEGQTLAPLGMANLYVGDGYKKNGKPAGLSNECMLVRTWGKVVSVDSQNRSFTISDGSGSALPVSAKSLRSGVSAWPKVGQYVSVTGISTASDTGQALRIRGQEDIEVLLEE